MAFEPFGTIFEAAFIFWKQLSGRSLGEVGLIGSIIAIFDLRRGSSL